MPVPAEYQRATDNFYQFLEDAKESSGLTSTHATYTMVQAVLQAFRRRLDIKDAIRFANILPASTRALFVADWNPDEPKKAFGDPASLLEEVKSLRSDHNFSPDTAVRDVALALKKNLDQKAFERLLSTLPAGAAEFWRT
ncbi:MAG: DUF2267 domain-containing protein [Bdellovibrionota bacterium]